MKTTILSIAAAAAITLCTAGAASAAPNASLEIIGDNGVSIQMVGFRHHGNGFRNYGNGVRNRGNGVRNRGYCPTYKYGLVTARHCLLNGGRRSTNGSHRPSVQRRYMHPNYSNGNREWRTDQLPSSTRKKCRRCKG